MSLDQDAGVAVAPEIGASWLQRHIAVLAPLGYLVAIAVAEYFTAVVNFRLGLPMHACILFALLVHGALTDDDALRGLLWSMTVGPLIRILSLSLPLGGIPLIYWYAIISVPVFAAAGIATWTLGYTPADVGLRLGRGLRWMPVYIVVGLLLGVVENRILQPQPLASSLSIGDLWLPIVILTVSTGFEEELIFRGLLQRAAGKVFGQDRGILFVTALFASLHIGYLSLVDIVFVFAVGFLLARLAKRDGTVGGVTAIHACINISLFLLAPYLIPLLGHA